MGERENRKEEKRWRDKSSVRIRLLKPCISCTVCPSITNYHDPKQQQ